MQCIQNNKRFYNYTLYMTVRFSINILLTTMCIILIPITNDRYNGHIPFLIFSRYYTYNL